MLDDLANAVSSTWTSDGVILKFYKPECWSGQR
jgi:hypothetical protein